MAEEEEKEDSWGHHHSRVLSVKLAVPQEPEEMGDR